MSIQRFLAIVIVTLCFVFFLSQTVSAVRFVDHDSGVVIVDWGIFAGLKKACYAWATVSYNEGKHGWFSAWAEVDGDRFLESGSHQGFVNSYDNKEKKVWIWQDALSVYSSAFIITES